MRLDSYLPERDTFHRDQYSGGKGHDLRSTAGGRIFGKEFAINFVDDCEVIAGDHEDGGLYDFIQAAARFLQDDLDVLKGLPCLVFKIIADNLAGLEVESRSAGDEDEVIGDDRLRKSLAHAGGLRGVEVGLVGHWTSYEISC
jgi:hypothetical protein